MTRTLRGDTLALRAALDRLFAALYALLGPMIRAACIVLAYTVLALAVIGSLYGFILLVWSAFPDRF